MHNPLIEPARRVEIARTLAQCADEGGVNHRQVCAQIGLRPGALRAGQSAEDLWYEIVEQVHAGRSRQVGFQADAVARLVDALAAELQGNLELSDLAHRLGRSGAPAPGGGGGRSVFLSYAHGDRADVDALHDALVRASPGLAVFQDHRTIAAGGQWLDLIRNAAGSAALMACWVTPAYLRSAFCNYEIGLAEHGGSRIVPVVPDPAGAAGAPAYLGMRQRIDAGSPCDFDDLAGRLLAVLP